MFKSITTNVFLSFFLSLYMLNLWLLNNADNRLLTIMLQLFRYIYVYIVYTGDAMRQMNGTSVQSILPRRNNLKHFFVYICYTTITQTHCLQAIQCLRWIYFSFEEEENFKLIKKKLNVWHKIRYITILSRLMSQSSRCHV